MARPHKTTVPYFPHYTTYDATDAIISRKFGAEGYGFIYLLKALLGRTPRHTIYCDTAIKWEYFLSETFVDDKTANEIIDFLCNLGELDKDIWETEKRIWWQSFVDLLDPVYDKRKGQKPTKHGFGHENRGFSSRNGVSDIDNSQSKVNNSKVNNSRGEKSNLSLPNEDLNELHKAFTGKANTTPTKTEISIYRDALENKSVNEWIPYCEERQKRQKSGSKVPSAKFFFDQDYTKFEQVQRKQNEKMQERFCPSCGDKKVVSANGSWNTICKPCGVQMIEKYEYDNMIRKRKESDVKSN